MLLQLKLTYVARFLGLCVLNTSLALPHIKVFEVIPGVILPRESAMHKFHTSFSETLTHKPKDNSSCMFLCEFMFSLPYFMQRKVQSVILCMCLLVFSSVFLQINVVFKSIIILSSI